mmetsp:Transcript_31997/g.73447  ORF Transcript_31997/g.73447 Transcript_31997/m.73447 type:complete len:296 (+) Transcript_31997:115-1002(+)
MESRKPEGGPSVGGLPGRSTAAVTTIPKGSFNLGNPRPIFNPLLRRRFLGRFWIAAISSSCMSSRRGCKPANTSSLTTLTQAAGGSPTASHPISLAGMRPPPESPRHCDRAAARLGDARGDPGAPPSRRGSRARVNVSGLAGMNDPRRGILEVQAWTSRCTASSAFCAPGSGPGASNEDEDHDEFLGSFRPRPFPLTEPSALSQRSTGATDVLRLPGNPNTFRKSEDSSSFGGSLRRRWAVCGATFTFLNPSIWSSIICLTVGSSENIESKARFVSRANTQYVSATTQAVRGLSG